MEDTVYVTFGSRFETDDVKVKISRMENMVGSASLDGLEKNLICNLQKWK